MRSSKLPKGFALLLLPCLVSASAFGQNPNTQNTNLQQLGGVLQSRPDSAPARPGSTAPRPLIQSAPHKDALAVMDSQINQATDAPTRTALQVHRNLSMLRFNQEEWVAPSLSDTTPDPLIAVAMSGPHPPMNQLMMWNHAALDITSIDHTANPNPIQHPEFGEQLGPPCTSRALAMVHLAMYETMMAIEEHVPPHTTNDADASSTDKVGPLTSSPITPDTADENAAIAQAAFAVLSELYPHKAQYLKVKWADPDDAAIKTGMQGSNVDGRISLGKHMGLQMAQRVMHSRAADGTQLASGGCNVGGTLSEMPDSGPGYPADPAYIWNGDPLHTNVLTTLGSNWGDVTPFVLKSGDQFRPPPPDLHSQAFKDSFQQVLQLGGDPHAATRDATATSAATAPTPTQRTADQTEAGKFWAYDGTPGLCAPPRLYNMIATSLATGERPITDPMEMAHFLALVNVAMADAAIAGWDGKFYYRLARPVQGIRAYTAPDGSHPYATWTPLGAQQTNTSTVNFTPPFPSYPSGHAVFGGAFFEVLRRYWNIQSGDEMPFTFVSDEFNGYNQDPRTGRPRPYRPRTYQTLGDAEAENGMSRIYLGIHWKMDADAGNTTGHQVGDWVFDRMSQLVN